MKPLQLAYYDELKSLVDSGKYDTKEDFTVVIQPMFVEPEFPVDVSLLHYYSVSLFRILYT